MLCYNRLKTNLKPISFTLKLMEQCFWQLLFIYFSSGSFSRSAVNYNAGAKTAVSNIVMASAVLVTLLFLMPLFYYTPNLILAAIILTAVIGLIDYQAAYKLWKVDKFDFFTCMCSFFGVLLVSVPLGLAIAVSTQLYVLLGSTNSQVVCYLSLIPFCCRLEFQFSRSCCMLQGQTL